ncbi:MAG: hypothetical protein HC831_17505, partial [Chloroflexia bacterium]|nr:hypothetical protein [Chloroflexia bacterium]
MGKSINESGRASADNVPRIRIEDCKEVQAADGTWIDMDNLDFEMESAKTAIVGQSPLFGPYIHEFRPIYTWVVPTMATDGIRLFVNPQFANELSWEAKIFVIIHEIMHCVLDHMGRTGTRDPQKSNIAADYEVNGVIIDTISDFDEAFIKSIHGLYDKKYVNDSFEQIYNDLEKNNAWPKPPPQQKPPQKKEEPCSECGGSGQVDDPNEGGGQGPQTKQPLKVGQKVKIKSSGNIGKISAINPDGSYEVEPLNEMLMALMEGYRENDLELVNDDPDGGEGDQGGNQGGGQDGRDKEAGQQPGQGQGPKAPGHGAPSGACQPGTGGQPGGQCTCGKCGGTGVEPGTGTPGGGSSGSRLGSGKARLRNGKEVNGVGGAHQRQIFDDVGQTGTIIPKKLGDKIEKETTGKGEVGKEKSDGAKGSGSVEDQFSDADVDPHANGQI